jgi:hypothetical protein
MFAAFWPFDWSFSGFLFIMFGLLWWTAWSVKETAKDAAKVVKKIAENETVQEAGKSVFHAWLESVFKKR